MSLKITVLPVDLLLTWGTTGHNHYIYPIDWDNDLQVPIELYDHSSYLHQVTPLFYALVNVHAYKYHYNDESDPTSTQHTMGT
jgi:hypothetical protein